MHLLKQCQDMPNVVLEVFAPPGHDTLIIQRQGKHPQDGIPFACLGDLVGLLQRLLDEMAQAPRSYLSPYEQAIRTMSETGEQFTPFLVPNHQSYAFFVLEVGNCANCNTVMIPKGRGFPRYTELSREKQLERAAWREGSGVDSDARGGELCTVCAESGLARFRCMLCGEERDYTLVEESIGDPPDYLCKVCFETRTAKEWNEAVDRLWKAHQWDHE